MMSIIPNMRAGVVAVVLAAAALLQGCAQGTFMSSGDDTGVYSGNDWYTALDTAMTANTDLGSN